MKFWKEYWTDDTLLYWRYSHFIDFLVSTLLFRSALLFLPRFKIVFAAAKALGLRKKSRLTLYMNLDLSASYLSAKLSEKEAQSLRLQDLLLEWNIKKRFYVIKWANLFMLSLSMVPIHICGNVDAINIPTYIYLYLATVRFIHVCITKKWEIFQSCILR